MDLRNGNLVWVKATERQGDVAVQVKIHSVSDSHAWVSFGKTPKPFSGEDGSVYDRMRYRIDQLMGTEPKYVTKLYYFDGRQKSIDWRDEI